jgi:hypothetical protein
VAAELGDRIALRVEGRTITRERALAHRTSQLSALVGNIQIVVYVHCVQISARSGRRRTIWMYPTPG